MTKKSLYFLLLNLGHFLDHLFMLIFATVAALALHREWGVSYGDLLNFATPGFIAFGIFSLPSGWLGDKWCRDGMMVVFFIGIGLASIATSFASSPFEVGLGLFIIGTFASIYHPVGLALVSIHWKNTGMRLAANGVWGNMGVGSAALLTGYMIDTTGWRMAFFIPGCFSFFCGIVYLLLRHQTIADSTFSRDNSSFSADETRKSFFEALKQHPLLIRIFSIVFITTILINILFQSTSFSLPKIFDERIQGFAKNSLDWFQLDQLSGQADVATMIGMLAFIVFTIASFGQLIVGYSLDKYGPRAVFMFLAALQLICFALMPGLQDEWAFIIALGFMLGAFGQIPINDFILSRIVSSEYRARIYGVQFVVGFTALAITLPFISVVYEGSGFDRLFKILAGIAFLTIAVLYFFPKRLPDDVIE
jgi:MFS family permease